MSTPRIVAMAGSLRTGSFNRKLLRMGVSTLEKAGASVDVVDLKELALPMYDGDVEDAGMPPVVVTLKERIAGAQGVLIATPEYNHSIPGGLKNLIDWTSRGGQQPWRGKVVAICGASAGAMGTVRGQLALRQSFGALGPFLLPQSVLVSDANNAFDESGVLKDAKKTKELADLCAELLRVAGGAPLLRGG